MFLDAILSNKKKHIYLASFVCNERIFDGLHFALRKNIFEQKINETCTLTLLRITRKVTKKMPLPVIGTI